MSTAWVFAGHGAQYVGMGRAILRHSAPGRDWLAAAERVSGRPLARLALQGPARQLSDPLVVEPLLAAVSGAYADLLEAEAGPPDAVAGYSAGHVAALYVAGVVDRETCLDIACRRGAALARAAQAWPGGMVSVHGLPEEQLVSLAEADDDEPASVAARNAPMHVVYSGREAALARAAARARAAGATVAPLDVAGPWHSPWMEPARSAIEADIAALPFAPARLPLWSTVTARPSEDAETLRWAVAASIATPAEWHATVQAMCDDGIDEFIEVSPGRSLWALLGQLSQDHRFTRHYVECVRGPATGRPRAEAPARRATAPRLINSQEVI